MTSPRKIDIHQSLNRPNLLLGCDRELLLSAGFIAAIMVFSLGTLWSLVTGFIFWIILLAVLTRLAKADPLMRLVYIQHIKYQSYMPAHAKFTGKRREIAAFWKLSNA